MGMNTLTMFDDVKSFTFTKDNMIMCRTGTNGYQSKFISDDKKYFVKGRAIISGVERNDWLCEIIASDFMQQLEILGVVQSECNINYYGTFKGVYSDNFELDGNVFISYQNRIYSQGEDPWRNPVFNKLSINEQLRYLAELVEKVADIPKDEYLKYLVDLCVIDILVGNMDRLPHNFGFFLSKDVLKVPLIFDCGMSLFEHEYDLDNVKTFQEAMRNVYVGPVCEDPFTLLHSLQDKGMLDTYDFSRLKMPKRIPNDFAEMYLEKIFKEL